MVYIGIDIAKRFHVLSAVDDDGRTVIESFKFANTDAGFKELLGRLKKAGIGPEGSLSGMEATGHYWVALFDFMGAHGYDAAVINPKNRATAILDRVFPELDGLFSGSFGPTQRKLLEHCATPEQVLSTNVRTLERILKEASNGKCGRAKADELKEAARKSVGVGFGSRTLAFEVRLLMEELDFIRGQIDEVETELARLLDETPGKWLLTVPGIGLALAAAIAGEVGDPNRFEGPHQLMAFAGMDPTKSESGETVASDGSMSKRGSAALRWAFMEAADSVRRYDPYFGDYYAKKKGEDRKHHYVALSGVARKLMGVCLALMKEGRPYEPAPPKHHRPGHLQEAAK